MNKNFVIEKESTDDRKQQYDPDSILMENSGKNWWRYSCDGLQLDNSNNLWSTKGVRVLDIRLTIEKLCDQQKLYLIFIVKPIIPYAQFLIGN